MVGAAATAIGGFFANRSLQQSRQHHELLAISNERLFSAALDFSQTSREMWHLACETSRRGQPGFDAELEACHAKLRALYARIRLVGDAAVQESARLIVREAYAARSVTTGGEDPRPVATGDNPQKRLNLELREFLTAARHQLDTADPGAVPSLDVDDD